MIGINSYNPNNWYWVVAGSTTQVYSSASSGTVPVTDATYQAWLAQGFLPTQIVSNTELLGVIAAQVTVTPLTTLLAGGLTVTSTGTPALSGLYAIDAQLQSDIATEAQFISTFSEFTTGATTNLPWILMNGSLVQFPTTTEFLALAKAVAQFVAAAKLAQAQGTAMPTASATIA